MLIFICKIAESKTLAQSESILWFGLRYKKITASKLYEASKCQTKRGSSVKQIIRAEKINKTKSMNMGKI